MILTIITASISGIMILFGINTAVWMYRQPSCDKHDPDRTMSLVLSTCIYIYVAGVIAVGLWMFPWAAFR